MARRRFGLAQQTKIMEKAARRKMNKYIWSGLIILGLGILAIAASTEFLSNPFSVKALAIGAGVIVVIIGIVRILIGLINPKIPSDLAALENPQTDDILFEQGSEGDSV